MRSTARKIKRDYAELREYPDWFIYHLSVVCPEVLYGRGYAPFGGRKRFAIFKRDSFRCRYCGRGPMDGVKLTIDHAHPRSDGGTNDPKNLLTACEDCNGAKGSDKLTEEEKHALGC